MPVSLVSLSVASLLLGGALAITINALIQLRILFRSVKLDFHRAFIIPKFSVCGSFFHLVTIVVLLEGLLSLRFFAINFTELQSWELDPRQVVQSVSDSFPEALTLQLKENKITMNRKKPFKLDLPAVYQTFFERTMFWMTRGKIPEDVWNAYELPEPTIYFTSDKHVGSYLNSYRGLQTESIFVFTETKVYFMGMAMSADFSEGSIVHSLFEVLGDDQSPGLLLANGPETYRVNQQSLQKLLVVLKGFPSENEHGADFSVDQEALYICMFLLCFTGSVITALWQTSDVLAFAFASYSLYCLLSPWIARFRPMDAGNISRNLKFSEITRVCNMCFALYISAKCTLEVFFGEFIVPKWLQGVFVVLSSVWIVIRVCKQSTVIRQYIEPVEAAPPTAQASIASSGENNFAESVAPTATAMGPAPVPDTVESEIILDQMQKVWITQKNGSLHPTGLSLDAFMASIAGAAAVPGS